MQSNVHRASRGIHTARMPIAGRDGHEGTVMIALFAAPVFVPALRQPDLSRFNSGTGGVAIFWANSIYRVLTRILLRAFNGQVALH